MLLLKNPSVIPHKDSALNDGLNDSVSPQFMLCFSPMVEILRGGAF